MDFVALDFETADFANSAPCSVGIAVVRNDVIIESSNYLMNPETDFNPYTIGVHGISPEMVEHAPTFPEIWERIACLFRKYPVVAHNANFDYSVLEKVCSRYDLPFPTKTRFYCSQQTAEEFGGFVSSRLPDLCRDLGICCDNHHVAENDAVACAKLMMRLVRIGAKPVRIHTPSSYSYHSTDTSFPYIESSKDLKSKKASYRFSKIRISDITPEQSTTAGGSPLSGKLIVFTGELSIGRRDAMQMAVNAGAVLKSSVSSKTDYLVVGKQDIDLVGEDGLSTKEEKAYALNESGKGHVQFLNEAEFLELLRGKEYAESVES